MCLAVPLRMAIVVMTAILVYQPPTVLDAPSVGPWQTCRRLTDSLFPERSVFSVIVITALALRWVRVLCSLPWRAL